MKLWTKEQRVLLGVSEKEGVLLDVLQREGALNTSALSYHAHLPRVTTMRILKTLKERGFVARKTQIREVVWSLEDASALEKRFVDMFGRNADSQKTTTLSEIGSLVVYKGIDAIIECNEKILAAHAGERVLAIEPNGIWKHVSGTSQDEITHMNMLFKEKQILIELVVEESFEKVIAESVNRQLGETFLALAVDIRVVPTRFLDSSTEVLIFRDQILFVDWAHMVAVEIKNPSTMRVMKAMYRLLQESGRVFQSER